ncbi:MAG: alkaline phosphatase D family protein [Chthoniobacterales bacterium]
MRAGILLLCALLFGATAAFPEETPETSALTRIAFGSCNREYRPQLLWKPILACQPQLWIWLGDIVYGRADVPGDLVRRYRSAKAQPDYQELRQRARVIGVWDDNDYGEKDGGAENAHKKESQEWILDFLDEPPASPRRAQAGIYAAYTFGPPGRQVKVILLDGHYHRGEPRELWSWITRTPEAESDILGDEQWAWLERELTDSSADIHLIGSGIQVLADEQPFEKWANFPRARRRLFDLLAKTRARNVILLSGDRHLGEISRAVDPRLPLPLYDITSSGMTHHAQSNILYDFKKEANRFRLGKNYPNFNFGLLEINWDGSPPVVTAQIRGVDNVLALEEKITLAPLPTTAP